MCRQAFKKIDHDNSGRIQLYELRHSLHDVCTEAQMNTIIEAADADRNGQMDFAEFLRIAQRPIPPNTISLIEMLNLPLKSQSIDDQRSHTIDGVGISMADKLEGALDGSGKKYVCCYIIPLIHPDSRFANGWQLLTALAIIYAALMTPVLLAFQDQFQGESKSQVVAVDNAVNTIFMMDVVVNFLLMYVDSSGELVSNPKVIALNYLKTWFSPDVISCVPLDLLLGSKDDQGFLYAKLARIGKLARVIRLLRILKMLKLLRLLKFLTHFDRMFQRVLSNDKYDSESSKTYQFLKFCIFALVVAHVAGCLWYALARFHENVDDTWIVSRGIEESEIIDQYLASMYFIITTLTTVGYGDISASTNAEIIVAILLMMGGVLGYSISVGTVSSVLMQEDQRNTIISNKMNTLAHFAKDTNMDVVEYGKIRRHIRRKYSESLDWMVHLEGPAQLQSLLTDLPVVLRAKMLRHMHHGKHLHLEFFSRYNEDDLFAYIVPLLFSAHFEAHDMVFLRGDYAERIYFLTQGTIVYFTLEGLERENNGRSQRGLMDRADLLELEKIHAQAEPFQVVVDGSTFGDFEVLLGIPRQECVRCDVPSHCLALHKRDILRTLAEFPSIAESMREDARKEYAATMKRKVAFLRAKGVNNHDLGADYDEHLASPKWGQYDGSESCGGSPEKPPTKPELERDISIVDISKIPSEKKQSKNKPSAKEVLAPAVQRLPTSPSRSIDSALAQRFQQIEERLEFIEEMGHKAQEAREQQDSTMKEIKEQQEVMTTEMRELRTVLFSMDLRIQSLVLRT